jgi:hypothetical protein
MRRERIKCGGAFRKNGVPRDLLWLWKQGKRSSGQSRHVQDLADRANAVRSTSVLVDEHAAGGEIQ